MVWLQGWPLREEVKDCPVLDTAGSCQLLYGLPQDTAEAISKAGEAFVGKEKKIKKRKNDKQIGVRKTIEKQQ